MGLLKLFKPDPRTRLMRELRRKSQQAVEMQRNGKLQEFAALTAEVQELERQLDALEGAR
ncbi:MAG: DUF6435 family protein [Myxococcales bacterium]